MEQPYKLLLKLMDINCYLDLEWIWLTLGDQHIISLTKKTDQSLRKNIPGDDAIWSRHEIQDSIP